MKYKKIVLNSFILFFIVLQSSVVYNQSGKELPFYNINKLNGLPSNYVISLTKDKRIDLPPTIYKKYIQIAKIIYG